MYTAVSSAESIAAFDLYLSYGEQWGLYVGYVQQLVLASLQDESQVQ